MEDSQIIPGRILNFLILGVENNDSALFLESFLSKEKPNESNLRDTSFLLMSTVALQWGQEVLCVNLTIVPSAARLSFAATSAYEKADAALFITSSPSIDSLQILERWMKEIKSRATNHNVSTFFIIQKQDNQKMQEKVTSNSLILGKGFDDVIQISKGSSEQAQNVVKNLVWHVMGNEPKQLTNSYGTLLAVATKGNISFGNIF
ncbi:hypothetical protein GPJ56_010908 [Histomonas meleagridis]|uniref:uncharacterized protein n=1 Tax=Histomonas meleagridis TaxID=135588 RepID=UPI00355A782B|nr:hypothetical protein GPJ56_010908 [Histomonas meleagridis]KAH0806291.1 hypothetical protein GO595_000979 [Histomonas meleagridis]